MRPRRPDPDRLLAHVTAVEAQEQRGNLKVFLGAAPGVGKTFAMLNAAHELRRQKVEVVVGIVETHGRAETQALVEGLEALLPRRPGVALVDELAHSNVPGVRHQRRWQDVEELLDAGIDVYTTLNVQHFEGLTGVSRDVTPRGGGHRGELPRW